MVGAPARAQPVQLASLEVVTQSSSFIGLPQYVSFMPGLATCTLQSPLAWRIFTRGQRPFSVGYGLPRTHLPRLWVNKAATLSACSKRGLRCLAHPSPPGLERLGYSCPVSPSPSNMVRYVGSEQA